MGDAANLFSHPQDRGESSAHYQLMGSLTCSGSLGMLRARLVEEQRHPRGASVLYDLSRSLEYPISASTEPQTKMGCCSAARRVLRELTFSGWLQRENL